jgi:hypothetical protein
MDVI